MDSVQSGSVDTIGTPDDELKLRAGLVIIADTLGELLRIE